MTELHMQLMKLYWDILTEMKHSCPGTAYALHEF